MRNLRLSLFLLFSPLILTGCGDGWETERVTDYVPYTMERTAGSGVAYVRAKMLPEKEVVVAENSGDAAPKGYEEIKNGDEIFSKAQTKGIAEPPPTAVKKNVEIEKAEKKNQAVEKINEEGAAKDKAAVVPAAGGDVSSKASMKSGSSVSVGVNTSEKKEAPRKSYEQLLDEKSSISPEKVEPHAGNAVIEKQSSLISAPVDASIDIVQVPEEVKYETKSTGSSVMPIKKINAPMMDIYNRDLEAEKSLEEIYSNPF